MTATPPGAAPDLLTGVTWYKQAAFRWVAGTVVYVDPWGLVGDLAPADLVLITHAHQDHFSKADIGRVVGARTAIVAPADVAKELSGNVRAVRPGDRLEVAGLKLEAVPAYNRVPGRESFHPKVRNWVGYVLEVGGRTYYHSGDTDHLPELERVRADVAFVAIGGKFTMDSGEASALVKAMRPKLAVPMHYGFFPGVGKPADGERFRQSASPVPVRVMTPLVPFTET